MAFAWEDYLKLARSLQGQSGAAAIQEAAHRSAVSRAYYAAFCHARNYARDSEGFLPSRGPKDHELVRDHYQRKGRPGLALDLDRLRAWRNRCDYDDTVTELAQMLPAALKSAQDILRRLPSRRDRGF